MNGTDERGIYWHTLKKSKPGWFRNWKRWEHGMEQASYEALLRIAKSRTVHVEVIEKVSPVDGTTDSECKPPGVRLWIPFDDIVQHGHRNERWPCGSGGPSGEGGWLWPRRLMRTDSGSVPVQARMF